MTKILLCNTAIRPEPDPFPPVALTTLHNALKRAGYDSTIFDIDASRPSDEQLFEYFAAGQFDIIGISSVVSTAYRYTQKVAGIIKKASPASRIILGGNMAAAYEVILRKCPIDVCVVGEGEKVLLNLANHYEQYRGFHHSHPGLAQIKGIVFLGADGNCLFTGHESPTRAEEIEEPDYDVVNQFSDLDKYLLDPLARYRYVPDARIREPQRRGQKVATIFTSKSCINKCTFCHRWVRGYRVISVEKVVATIKDLKSKFNVGFFCIADECFGENRVWLDEFIRQVKPLDVLFEIAGARVDIIKKDPTIVAKLKEVGMIAIYFGMESGSDKILKIMEKNATRAENLFAAKVCAEAGVYTIIQLVIGMPGENEETIDETIDFVKSATGELPYFPLLSVNYLQALPGTPCYDYLRYHGLLGRTVEDEEQYLLKVSDINASEYKQYINVSEEPMPRVKMWKRKIILSYMANWLRHHGWHFPAADQVEYFNKKSAGHPSLFGRLKSLAKSQALAYRLLEAMGVWFWEMILLGNRLSLYGAKKAAYIYCGLIKEDDRSLFKIEADSLKTIMDRLKC